jgi:UDP-galactopyranose mutase
VGRLAHYKYYNMDAAIEAALNITDAFLTRQTESAL